MQCRAATPQISPSLSTADDLGLKGQPCETILGAGRGRREGNTTDHLQRGGTLLRACTWSLYVLQMKSSCFRCRMTPVDTASWPQYRCTKPAQKGKAISGAPSRQSRLIRTSSTHAGRGRAAAGSPMDAPRQQLMRLRPAWELHPHDQRRYAMETGWTASACQHASLRG